MSELSQLFDRCRHQQPNADMCFICGRSNPIGLYMKFFDDGGNTVVSRCTPDNRYESYPGIVHGGILATILDEVVGRVAMIDDHHRFMMTVNLRAQYRKPVPVHNELRAVGELVKIKGRIGKAVGKIFLPDDSLACEAELTLATMPDAVAGDSRLGALDWKMD